ncbi:MAG: HypC/HybG/HupF family hydrogenase formation chaperone [Candidatus Diapherotrites archaeon]|nr:HypC/HybG/HupF family hydrogenase formation chaperone [Candidatus Diapherotrites archaeon]
MCLAYKAKVLKVNKNKLLVASGKEKKEVLNALQEVREGDFVLVQQGIAVDLID